MVGYVYDLHVLTPVNPSGKGVSAVPDERPSIATWDISCLIDQLSNQGIAVNRQASQQELTYHIGDQRESALIPLGVNFQSFRDATERPDTAGLVAYILRTGAESGVFVMSGLKMILTDQVLPSFPDLDSRVIRDHPCYDRIFIPPMHGPLCFLSYFGDVSEGVRQVTAAKEALDRFHASHILKQSYSKR